MTAIILSVGDELTLGQTVDTNSAWLSQQLATIGLPVRAHVTVPDDQKAIEQAIRYAARRADVLLITGGIGPTPDDLTRQALATVMGLPLELNEQWLAVLRAFFAKRNRPMPEMNKIQAMVPLGATMIANTCGTAAGIEATINPYALIAATAPSGPRASDEYLERLFGNEAVHQREVDELRRMTADDLLLRRVTLGLSGPVHVFVMPGVPKEMKEMFRLDVLPKLRKATGGEVILSKTLHTFGQGESTIAELLGPLMDRTRNPSVGTTVSAGIVSVRINARFPTKDEAQHHLDATVQECHSTLGDLIFGEDDTTLPEAVARLLIASGKTVTTAESCTGGLLAKYLTDIPGSSAYFKQGWITYSNEAKTSLLGVRPELIAAHGAVSENTAVEMAIGAAFRARANYGLAVSGIAGPEGGTPDKPVGTVCIAMAFWDHRTHPAGAPDSTEVAARRFLFPGDREMIRDRSAKMALTMLRYHLLGKPLPF